MPWFLPYHRGPEWKQGWRAQTLSSMSAPPFPLLTLFAIVLLLLSLSHYMNYREQLYQASTTFQFLFFLVPLLLVLVVRNLSVHGGRLDVHLPRPEHGAIHRAGSSPWGVAALVLLLLLMISYQSSFHSKWFRPLWRSDPVV